MFPVTLAFNLLLSTCIMLLLYRRKELDLRSLARVDSLTGVANRTAMDAQSVIEMSRARRYGEPLSIIMFDLDHFKTVNDTHGHAAGDKVLRQAARALEQGLRESDGVFRVGGEEFLLLLPRTAADGAAQIAERLRKRIEESPIVEGSSPLRVTGSFGIADLRPDEDWSALVARADQALYSAKRDGRNCVRTATQQSRQSPNI